MSRAMVGLMIGCFAGSLHASTTLTADSVRGAQIFESRSCNQCHSINGKGGTLAPDLGKTFARDYTPSGFTALMWNHAPKMWSAMSEKGMQTKPLSEQDAADLFAYFASVRMFEKPADAGRGKRLFASKHCQDCHGGTGSNGAKPLTAWTSVGDPIALSAAMWNHSAGMRKALADSKTGWPKLTGQELSDILIYVRSTPATRQAAKDVHASLSGGSTNLFESKGCVQCHTGAMALGPRVRAMTMNDIAAAMWNHQQDMGPAAKLTEPEMRELIASMWSVRLTEVSGNPARGGKLYNSNCSGCHAGSAAPSLQSQKGKVSPVSMVSSLSSHGPRMLEQIRLKNLTWPQFTETQMADLIAYLNRGQ